MRYAELSSDTVGICVPQVVNVANLLCKVWYFFNDVYPPLHNGHRPLDPPQWWVRLFERPTVEGNTAAEPINHDLAAAAAPPPEVR